ncbi:MAG TPA: hypothetical protein VFG30_04745 [Polyangiales bacterium]|nr:hypothetical protein [Polyangiales bacterium]
MRVAVQQREVEVLCSIAVVALLGACSAEKSGKNLPVAGTAAEAGSKATAGSAGTQPRAGTNATAGNGAGAGHSGATGQGGAGQAGTSMAGRGGDAADGGAAASGAAGLCKQRGWCQLTDTKLESVCPDPKQFAQVQGYEGCGGVINDWSGGMADTKRNRLILWGGGHHGYYGNELYALDLNAPEMRRLNDPSSVEGIDFDSCTPPEQYGDGRPSSRHTYDGMVLLSELDKMYTFAGAGVPCGYGVQYTWLLDLSAIESSKAGQAAPWQNMNPSSHPEKAAYGLVADYDAARKRVVLNDGYNLWSYDPAANEYALLNDSNKTNAHIDYHMTGRIDPKRDLFIVVGGGGAADGGMQVFDVGEGSDYAQQNWGEQVEGCEGLLAAESPGFEYDAAQERFVGWAGGDDVYSFDPDAKRCSVMVFAGGPKLTASGGTFGRFRYFPALKLFAVVTDPRADAYALRLQD